MNHWLFEQINEFARATPWLHAPAKSLADYGIVLFAVLLVIGWWIGRRSGDPTRVAAAISAGIATLIAVAVNVPIVQAVHEARPYATHHDILVVANHTTDPSFARVYIAAHYPVDVAAGIVLGGIVAVGYWLLVRKALTRVVEDLAGTRIRPLVLSPELS